ncbi:MAG: hypothetical protein ACYDH9_27120 [Limisphaerales bacterium]
MFPTRTKIPTLYQGFSVFQPPSRLTIKQKTLRAILSPNKLVDHKSSKDALRQLVQAERLFRREWAGPPYQLVVSNLAVGIYTLSARIKSLSGLASTGVVARVTISDFLSYAAGFDREGNFHLRVGGPVPGTTTVVEASPDLMAWSPLTTNVVVTNYLDFVDVGATNDCQRFYRLVRVP